MEKEALLNIIINDLKEVDLLMNTFKNLNSIDPEFLQLSMSKINQITMEMKMLEKFVAKGERLYPPATAVNSVIDEPASPIVSNEVLVETKQPEVAAVVIEEVVELPKVEVVEPNFIEPVVIEPVIIEPKQTEPKQTEKEEPFLVIEETPIVNEVEESPIIAEVEVIEDRVVVDEIKIVEEVIPEPIPVEIVKEAIVAEQPKSIEPKIEVKSEKHILKDLIGTPTKSVNEIMSEKKPLPTGVGANIVVPVANIYKAIGINDKMLFQRELFASNGAKMNSTIDQLNEMKDFDEALSFLKSNYEWDFESERTISFLNIIKRRYI